MTTSNLDNDGCLWGQKQTALNNMEIKNLREHYDSKISSIQTVARTMLDLAEKNREEIGNLKTISIENKNYAQAAITSSKEAIKSSEDTRNEWRGVWWKIVFGTMLGNATVFALIYFLFEHLKR